MVDPDRSLLRTLVGIGGTEMPFRPNHDPAGGRKGGRGPVGKIVIVGAVELSAQGEPPPYPSGADPRWLVEDPA